MYMCADLLKTNIIVLQLQSSQDELHEEKSKRYKSKEVPEVNGPEMQLYEVQSMYVWC